jgi:hypothetical protein
VDWAVFKEHLFAAVCLSGISVFWFLPALFFGELLLIGIRKKNSGAVCAAAVVALAAAAYLALMGENRLYAAFSETGWMPYLHLFLNALIRVPFAAAFVAAGYAACPLLKKMSVRTWQNLAAGILCMAVTFAVSRLNGITDMNYMVYNNILLYLVTSLCGSFGIIFLSRWLERWCGTAPLKALIYYGKNSLVVMMTHAPFYIMYLAARFTYGVNNHIVPLGQFPLCAMMVCVVLVIEIPVCELINRYFPFLIGKSKI